jgi:hypothetical protein
MRYKTISGLVTFGLVLLAAALLFVAVPGVAMVSAEKSAAIPFSQGGTPSEFWKLGVTSRGSADYSAVAGRLASEVAAFQSSEAADIYFVFPAPATTKTVGSARFYILSRSGSYVGAATMTLEVYDLAGGSQHLVSASPIDMQTAATDAWTAVTLSGTAGDLEIAPGEVLAFHFALSGAAGNDLDVRPIFEIEVE